MPIDDVQEVSNYVAAMEHGLEQIEAGSAISLNLIQNIHGILLRSGRGEAQAMPGRFRQRQNWVGGPRPSVALFVPPPPERVLALMENLEQFINAEDRRIPALIKAGLMHVQFETSIPFWTATAGSGGCSSRSCSAIAAFSGTRCFISACT